MRVKITDRCKIWEINDKQGTAEIKFSCSRKIKEDSSYDQTLVEHGIAKNGYVATYFSFVRFVGHAYNQLKKIELGDTITNLDATIEYEPYWNANDNYIAYPKNPKITVFEFEVYNPENQEYSQTRNLDKAPVVAESAPQVAPVQTPIVPVQPVTSMQPVADTSMADDECPF
jgi:hypothetical protein|nr:MAG TPA: hypothetical protein [Caudoviricetes sp.]